jgi:putative flippase GtrA
VSVRQLDQNELVIPEQTGRLRLGTLVARLQEVRRSQSLGQFFKYALVGALGAVIDFSVLNLLIFGAGWNSDLGTLLANVVSTSAAILSNFFWNRLWTFSDAQDPSAGKQLTKFVLVSLSGLVINTAIFFVTYHLILTPILPAGIAVQLAKVTAIGLVLFWNFNLNRLWTFRQPTPSPEARS